MTDYCFNELVFFGKIQRINELLSFLGDENGGFSFHKICPEPDEKGENWDWYNWRKENWSTKWECENVTRTTKTEKFCKYVYVKFDCPWKPPFKIIDKITDLFFDIGVVLTSKIENEFYKSKVIVRQPDGLWNILYDEELNDEIQCLILNNSDEMSNITGWIFSDVYNEMMKFSGFRKSLEFLEFRKDWLKTTG